MTRRILGAFAHPDDEVFCAGGTLARYAAGGDVTMVLSATRGEAGQIRDVSTATRSTLGAVREQELRHACAHLGAHDVRLLEHIDGTLGDVDIGTLVDEVGAVIDEFGPDAVITFGPDGLYGHPDHIAISVATTAACASRPGVSLFHSLFPRSRLLLVDRLAEWLTELRERFPAAVDFAQAFSLFAAETNAVGFSDDHLEYVWFPPGVSIVEQGELSDRLYLILSGEVEVTQDDADGSRRTLRRQHAGEFFGELGVASAGPRTANVVSTEAVTCLVFSRRVATAWDGRGTDAQLVGVDPAAAADPSTGPNLAGTIVIDVRAHLDAKLAALAAHRSQYPIDPAMFPHWMVEEMMGFEWFVRVQPRVEPATDLFA